MTSNASSSELDDFLRKYPETRFMDVFVPDLNGILRGKRIQTEELCCIDSPDECTGGSFRNHQLW